MFKGESEFKLDLKPKFKGQGGKYKYNIPGIIRPSLCFINVTLYYSCSHGKQAQQYPFYLKWMLSHV